jgi:hypothetical protein
MITQKMIRETMDCWQPYSKEKLTEEDAREIIENTVALFDLLDELDRKYNKQSGHI